VALLDDGRLFWRRVGLTWGALAVPGLIAVVWAAAFSSPRSLEEGLLGAAGLLWCLGAFAAAFVLTVARYLRDAAAATPRRVGR